MRLLLFYDLPTTNKTHIRQASVFRRNLIKLGFIMIQESIYVKFSNTIESANRTIIRLSNFLPESGDIRILKVTEKQYDSILFLKGGKSLDELTLTKESLIII